MSALDQIDAETKSLIEEVQDNPIALLTLARTLLLSKGKMEAAVFLSDVALNLSPDDPEVRALAHLIRSRAVGAWYFTMVQDQRRQALYAQALRQVLTPGCTVLDIGAGTGLFAMIAAREGAAKVVACERNPIVAKSAREIIRKNGFLGHVSVIAKDSRDLRIGVDLDGPADVLLWDNLSNDLLGGGALDTIEDARRRLLKPGAAIIPQACEIRVALIQASPATAIEMGHVDGFDMTAFNRLRPTQFTLGRSKFERRSNVATIFAFDFAADQLVKPQASAATVAATGGTVDGIAQWLRFHVADETLYDTGDDGVTAFGIQYHAVEPFEAKAGQPVTISGAHDRRSVWFWIDGEKGSRRDPRVRQGQ